MLQSRNLFAPRIAAVIAIAIAALAVPAAPAAEDLSVREEAAMKAALAHVAPSVVRIEIVGALERGGSLNANSGISSGLIVSADGYLVTSSYNFAKRPTSVLVRLADGRRLAAKIVAEDHSRMIVLLKVQSDTPLVVPEGAPLEGVEVGAWALAVGRTYEGGGANLSVGIVSAVDRVWGKAVQTDAKISPANYGGPLVDIAGRVIGVLAPLPVEAAGDASGSELYDSGIGFAVPLAHIRRMLPRMMQGEDLLPGLLGISLASTDMFSAPAGVAAVRPGSPAHKAGLLAGDTIVAVDSQPVTRIAELRRFSLSRYAGDKLQITVERKGARSTHEVELAAKLEPYEHPFVGILPARQPGSTEGCVVRHVYPESPAATAGLMPGDRITKCAAEAIAGEAALRQQIRQRLVGDTVRLTAVRGKETKTFDVRLVPVPLAAPPEIPPAPLPAKPDAPPSADATGEVTIKIPELENKCVAFVPKAYAAGASCGLVVWLHGPSDPKPDKLLAAWRQLCEQRHLILLAPQAADKGKWSLREVRFVRQAVDRVLRTYRVDGNRVVVGGYQAGGALAWIAALVHRDIVRGVVTVQAPLPMQVQLPDTDPVYPLAVYAASSPASAVAITTAGMKRLRAEKYPVTTKLLDRDRDLNEAELAELARWIDALDRI